MSEAEHELKQTMKKTSQLGGKGGADDQAISEATKDSSLDAEDSMMHEGKSSNKVKEKGNMLVIAGKVTNRFQRSYESVPFE